MMKQILFTFIVVLTCISCTKFDDDMGSREEVLINGNKILDNHSSNMPQRSADNRQVPHTLTEGAQISFYAQGGISCNGSLLTYSQGIWKKDAKIYWEDKTSSAHVCAYNPPLPNDVKGFYTEDKQLTDRLIAQKTYPTEGPITLQFEHLFAKIEFTIDEPLNKKLNQLVLSNLYPITSFNPYTCQFTTDKQAHTDAITFTAQTSGIYSLLLPPDIPQKIKIQITTQDNRILEKELPLQTITRNQIYSFHIKEKAASIGIETAEDYIAFTNLINETPYQNRSLKEFGVSSGNQTTYFLANDIVFTEEQSKRVRQIGLKGFSAIFDGRGHSLSNLHLQEEKKEQAGIFTEISPQGIVQNLRLINCTTSFRKPGGYNGLICGKNNGTISHCSIENCEIKNNKNKVGGIAGNNYGMIIDCQVNGLILSINQDKTDTQAIIAGGITHANNTNAKIINCSVCGIQEGTGMNEATYLSCLTDVNNGTVTNCTTDQCSAKFHPFCRCCYSACDHCYFPSEMEFFSKKTKGMDSTTQVKFRVLPFHESVKSHETTVYLLNKWIDNQGKERYPTHTFRRWTLSSGHSIVFEK